MKKIANKIILLTVANLLILAIILVVIGLTQINRVRTHSTNTLEETLKSDFDRKVKEQVQNVISLLEKIHAEHLAGEYNLDTAKLHAANYVRELRYGNDGYFWVDTKEGVNVVLLGKDSEGENRYNMQDKLGNYFIKDIINNALSGDGYTNYWFPKPGEDEPSPKRSFSQFFEPFGWVVGTGNYIDNIDAIIQEENAKISSLVKRLTLIFILGTVAMVFGSVISSIVFGRRLAAPIVELSKVMEQVAEGNLQVKIKNQAQDEVGDLGRSVENMLNNLTNIVNSVVNSSNNIADASNQMSSTSQQLSEGANEQASSVEEVSSTMEQMAANIEQNTNNSIQTQKISSNAQLGIEEVSKSSTESVTATNKISEKISIISDIAFQTNILALNAAVEAARAGEHGKGFAVVAAEVRKLAERSKVAADEIIELAQSSKQLVSNTGQRMTEILPEVEQTAQLVQEITAASQEQNNGANQVNDAMQQLNNVTQQNAAASEELASSSEELNRQAMLLKDMVKFFKTDISATANKHAGKRLQTDRPVPQSVKSTSTSEIVLNKDDSSFDDFEKF